MVLVSLFQDGEPLVLPLDLVDSVLVLLPKLLVPVTLNSYGGRLELWVMCSLRRFINHDHLFEILIPHRSLTFVHGLVLLFYGFFVAERGVHLLLDYRFHGVGHLVGQWVKKFGLRILFSFRQRTHSYELLNVPLVSLTQLLELHIHHLLIDDVDEEISQALVQFDAIGVRKARFDDDCLLLFA